MDGAQQQHEPDGAKHLSSWDAMILVDGHVEERGCHCRGSRSEFQCQTIQTSDTVEQVIKVRS